MRDAAYGANNVGAASNHWSTKGHAEGRDCTCMTQLTKMCQCAAAQWHFSATSGSCDYGSDVAQDDCLGAVTTLQCMFCQLRDLCSGIERNVANNGDILLHRNKQVEFYIRSPHTVQTFG